MALIYNSSLTKELVDGAKIATSRDNVPNQIADKVVPVMEVNPKMLRTINKVVYNGNTATAGVTVYTTPATQDFYLVGFVLTLDKDAACDNTSCFGRLRAGGATINFAYMGNLTSTAEHKEIALTFPQPIKCDRNSAIDVNGSFTVGTLSKQLVIFGYVDDSSLA
jgi:hypothetical protein